ncbi:MAG: pyruvate kinase [Myxococcales bacterium]|nr:pyruvate kinase [Myxococcales bacterium]
MSIPSRIRQTKLIATLGPACDDVAILAQMIHAGMNVARLNFSHGSHAEHEARLARLAQACERAGRTVATMLDTRGIEIRLGDFASGIVELEPGESFVLDPKIRSGDVHGVSVNQAGLGSALSEGDPILLDDGSIELVVTEVDGDRLTCRVEAGGLLRSRKGVNLPHTDLQHRPMGPENEDDLRFAAEHEMDYVAASFVRNATDVLDLRTILEAAGSDIPIIAKIESRSGVENLAEIVAAANGTMVARGDLGVELPVEDVPSVQKKIIRATVMQGKPVITATQMLDSMERNPRPTRAEVSDVANAIYDGTSAVMLSGETAVGKYPVEAVRTMAKLAQKAEASLGEYGHLQHVHPDAGNQVSEAVSQAAITMAEHLHAAAIVTLTESGYTSRMISKYRPPCPILAVTGSARVERRLCMNWGITALRYSDDHRDDEKIGFAIERAREIGYVVPGDVVIVTAGLSMQSGSTDMIRVLTVDG